MSAPLTASNRNAVVAYIAHIPDCIFILPTKQLISYLIIGKCVRTEEFVDFDTLIHE